MTNVPSEPAFAPVRLNRLVHFTSNVNESCKRNIFTSQFHRLRRVITDPRNFCYEIALVINELHAQGYSQPRLVARLHDLLAAFPFLYHHARRTEHLNLFDETRRHL